MHKNILAALTADEAVAFGVVEPLHCSLFCHMDTCVPLIDLRWRDSEVLKAGYWLVGRELLTDRFDLTHEQPYAPYSQLASIKTKWDSEIRRVRACSGAASTKAFETRYTIGA
jgi:hypothetical protein